MLGRTLMKTLIPRECRSLISSLIHIGKEVNCPCCGWNFRKFLPYGVEVRENAMCPRCGSLERHRSLWFYLKNKTNFFFDNLKVLHFAPEYCFLKTFKSIPNLDYVSADLTSSLADVKMDITNIMYDDNSFDVILCCHVLEHIPDDFRALTELFRVLKPRGWAILQVPIDLSRDKTIEDTNMTMLPEERERVFGLKEHVRLYGKDYKDRLEKAGFTVKVDTYVKELGNDVIKKYGLAKNEDIYYCVKKNS